MARPSTPSPVRIDGDLAHIALTQGRYATVDLVDLPLIEGQHLAILSGHVYVALGHRKYVPLSRRICLGTDLALIDIDHIDNDPLNNRRSNLRPATASENAANKKKRPGCGSRFKGVARCRRNDMWQAVLRSSGTLRHLGYFLDEETAARAYDSAARLSQGEFARLNFPLPGERGALAEVAA